MAGESGEVALSTRTCAFWREGGVLRARFHDGAEVQGDDARDNVEASMRLRGGAPVPLAVDLRPARSQSAEARAIFAGPEGAQIASATALIIASPLSRVLGSFYLRVNKPAVPTRLFTSEADALRWLRGLLASSSRARAGGER
jgi:hypothetical protein